MTRRHLFTCFTILLLSLTLAARAATAANSIIIVDLLNDVGWDTSLALDVAGNPVVSYYDATNGDLKILHCNDPACAGYDESITSPDTVGSVGAYSSLALDAAGNPVVTYFDWTNADLKVLHCDDPNCAGGGESFTSPDTGGSVGTYTSLALDAAGNPVISYADNSNGDLKLMHCNDANCAGADESMTSPDTEGIVGLFSSLVLDAAGNPVISHYDSTNGDLKLLRCDDPNCAGGGESITAPDTEGNVGYATSLALDAAGNPVVGYQHIGNGDLKVLHCNDLNCAGGDDSINSPDTMANVGWDSSLALDTAGNPIVSYGDVTNGDLKLLHCDDPLCAGEESIIVVDATDNVGYEGSLALDATGNPVVSYYDFTNSALKLVRCDNAACATVDGTMTSPDVTGSVGFFSSLVLDGTGNPVVSYYDQTNADLKLLHCDDPSCSGGGESITSPDTTGNVGRETSLALDADGNPVVSYYDLTNSGLKILHCNDPDCRGNDESITSPDTTGNVGYDTSLALDASGNPVVSYHDLTNGNLKVLHCNDPNCAGSGESITSPDTVGNVGADTTLVLDSAGNPVVAYFDSTNGDLKVLHCNDPNCGGGGESITSPDTEGIVGWEPSLALDGAGNPVISYLDRLNVDLKVLHCNDANCAGGGESITSPDTDGFVGEWSRLVLDADGNPVVSYYDNDNDDLKVLYCNDPNCAGDDESITSPDSAASVGRKSSLVLDSAGNPVIAYYDLTNEDLKLLHCFNRYCGLNMAPHVDAGADQVVGEGDAVDFSGSAGDPEGRAITFHWDFGDGAGVDGTLTPQHVYSDDGDYAVTLTAVDDRGLASTDMLTIVVGNVPPAVDAGPDAAVQVGEALQFTGSFADPGAADTHEITWDFGDGETDSGSLAPSHTFANPGVYTVTLAVTDDDGGVGKDMLTVTVTAPAVVHWMLLPVIFGR